MPSALVRLAVFQMLAVFYCVLSTGMILKIRFGSTPPMFFGTYLRDYGIILLLVPLGWIIWAMIEMHRPRTHIGDASGVIGGGIGVLVFLVILAIFGTYSTAMYGHHVLVYTVQQSSESTATPHTRRARAHALTDRLEQADPSTSDPRTSSPQR